MSLFGLLGWRRQSFGLVNPFGSPICSLVLVVSHRQDNKSYKNIVLVIGCDTTQNFYRVGMIREWGVEVSEMEAKWAGAVGVKKRSQRR